MILPGENYSEQLMFSLMAYRETWADARSAALLGETIDALSRSSGAKKTDAKQIKSLKKSIPQSEFSEVIDFAIDAFDVGRKGLRFSKVAAPLILADGPLPFGDVVFAVALGLDFTIAAYNLVSNDD